MSNTIDLTELIPRVHTAAKANGWWDAPRNAGEALMLCVAELSEALEADRTGRVCNMQRYAGKCEALHRAFCPDAFREHIKDSAADELADAYIRLCDFAGGFGLAAQNIAAHREGFRIIRLPGNFGAALLQIVRAIDSIDITGATESRVAQGLAGIENLCAREGIDLATHIDLKLTYNATRGHKHNGKLY